MIKRVVVISDMQIPDHDVKAVEALMDFVYDYSPDELYCVGDEADSPEPSRWTKGYALEYAGTLQKGLDTTKDVIANFRRVLGGKPFHIMRSNHGDRIKQYINKYAPALASLRDIEYEKLLGYGELDIKFHHRPWEFAPRWLLAHGDEGALIRTAGGTALNLAKRVGMSVVCGHTHRLGLQHQHAAVNGKVISRLYGFEVGNLMALDRASYLKAGSANWQSGFGILYIDRAKVTPVPVPIVNRSFTVEGQTYKW